MELLLFAALDNIDRIYYNKAIGSSFFMNHEFFPKIVGKTRLKAFNKNKIRKRNKRRSQ